MPPLVSPGMLGGQHPREAAGHGQRLLQACAAAAIRRHSRTSPVT